MKIIISIFITSFFIYANFDIEKIKDMSYRKMQRDLTGNQNETDRCWKKYWDYNKKSGSYYHKVNNENNQMKKVLTANHINYSVILNTLRIRYKNEHKEPIKYKKEETIRSELENCNNQYENLYNTRNNNIKIIEDENEELKKLIEANHLGYENNQRIKQKVKIEIK